MVITCTLPAIPSYKNSGKLQIGCDAHKGSHFIDSHIEQLSAGIVLMDQFTRNMYRGSKDMCAHLPSPAFCARDTGMRVWSSKETKSYFEFRV